MSDSDIIIRPLIHSDYLETWKAMQDFTENRNADTCDELWFIEHPPVYTLGQGGKREHILNPGSIPVIPIDRGGQVTYHGPGQLMVYVLLDLKRQKLSVRDLVSGLENTIIQVLADYQISACSKKEAPGVYIDAAKICSIGLRIKRGCSYHGLAFNVCMDLKPFLGINPCGFTHLVMTQLSDFVDTSSLETVIPALTGYFLKNLGYTKPIFSSTKDKQNLCPI